MLFKNLESGQYFTCRWDASRVVYQKIDPVVRHMKVAGTDALGQSEVNTKREDDGRLLYMGPDAECTVYTETVK